MDSRKQPIEEQTGVASGNGMVMGAAYGLVLGPMFGFGVLGLILGAAIGLIAGATFTPHNPTQ